MYFKKTIIELDSDFPLRLMDATIAPSEGEMFYHWHDCVEISYVRSGRGRYLVEGREYTMEPGDVIVFNNLEPHGWEAFPPEPMIQPVLVFDPSLIWAGEVNLFDYQYIKPFTQRGTNFSNKLPGKHPGTVKIINLLVQIEEEYKNKETGYKLMIKAKLLNIITILIRYFQDSNKSLDNIHVKQEHLIRLESVLHYIKNNYQNDIRLNEVANIAFMNSNYFSAFFKKTIGLSFKEYIIKLRLNHASELLCSNMSVIEAATESGFNSISNFYKAHAKYYGKKDDKPCSD